MIIQKELQVISNKLKIQPAVLDKDWVLGHFLNAMFEVDTVSSNFVFKGGTCLKKCYFENYRYSEDLDFTLINADFIIDIKLFNKIISIAERNSGANFYCKNIKLQLFNDIPQGYEVTILYWGADHKPNQEILPVERWQTKIKLDISYSEKVLLQPLIKSISHNYSDAEIIQSKVPVYPINEIAAEKLRSLLQRNRPRDIYDLFFLSGTINNQQYFHIFKLLELKSINKNIKCCIKENFVNSLKYRNNKRAWESSLGHHLAIGNLVNFDIAYERVTQFVENVLNSNTAK